MRNGWCIGVVLGCLAAGPGLPIQAAAAKECGLKRIGSAELAIRDGHLSVPVALNEQATSMELDTSNGVTLIGSGYLEPFGLRAYPIDEVTVSFRGTLLQRVTPVKSFTVGSQRFGKLDLWVLPDNAPPGTLSLPSVGRLGMDLLGAADFELDFANNKLNFYSQEHCPGVVVYWTNRYSSAHIRRGPLGTYYFPIELEGKTVQANLSTALAGTTISTQLTRRLYGFDEKSEGVETESDSTGRPVAYYRAMTLTGDGISIKNAKIRLDPAAPQESCAARLQLEGADLYSNCEGREPTLSLGLNVARRLHLYFATRERVLYFSEADASK